MIGNPHDPETRYAEHHNGKAWEGYKVHFTETCDPEQPRLITDVRVAVATQSDKEALAAIHPELARRQCLPAQHLVDMGYTAGALFLDSRRLYGIDLVGPVANISSWQARQEGGLTAEQFQLDWENRQAHCPAGKPARTWAESQDQYGHPVVEVRFSPADCAACSRRSHCTRSPQGRSLKLRPYFALLREARQQQHTAAFQQEYAPRAGIEGTIADAVRAHGARVSRYLGQSKTWLQETLLAAAINLERAARWLVGDRPETTRISRFMALAPAQTLAG